MRRIVLPVVTLVTLAVFIPLSVVAAAQLGWRPQHWSGAELGDVVWSARDPLPPQEFRDLAAQVYEAADRQPADLAGLSHDAGSGELVLYAATDEGERRLAEVAAGAAVAWRVERVTYSRTQLEGYQDLIGDDSRGIMRAKPVRVVSVGAAEQCNCVLLSAVRLDHDLFWRLGEFGDAAGVEYAPNHAILYMGGPQPGEPTSYWDPGTLPGTYLVLLTGFPWHTGMLALAAAAAWAIALVVRRRQGAVVDRVSSSTENPVDSADPT